MNANRPISLSTQAIFSTLCLASVITACSTLGGQKLPKLYPNAQLQKVGQAQADADIQACMSMAEANGVSSANGKVLQGAAEGAAVAGAAAAVGSAVSGANRQSIAKTAAVAGATGGTAGAVKGLFNNDPNGLYVNFVNHCLSQKGYQVIGWQ